MGGLSRRNTAIDTLKSSGPSVVVDVGGSLLKSGSLNGAGAEQARIKAALIAERLSAGGLDVMTLSSTDWQVGSSTIFEWVESYGLPVLAANLRCQDVAPFPPYKVIESGGRRLGFVGVTAGQIDGCVLLDSQKAIASAWADMGQVDVRILLMPEEGRKAAEFIGSGADVLLYLGGGRGVPKDGDGAVSFSLLPRGKTLGNVTLTWTEKGTLWRRGGALADLNKTHERLKRRMASLERRIVKATSKEEQERLQKPKKRVEEDMKRLIMDMQKAEEASQILAHVASMAEISLDDTIMEHKETQERIASALLAITELELVEPIGGSTVRPRLADAKSAFLGADGCAGCHPSETKQWLSTPHAKAMTTLEADKHHADRACVGCHSTGYGAPEGPENPQDIRGLRDVQCEACHGPGRMHALNPKGRPLARVPNDATCVFCHDGERDEGRFQREVYWPKIVHSSSQR